MIQQNIVRVGNFNSSEIVALTKQNKAKTGFGVAAITFIEECNFERRLGRSITDEVNAKPLTWGKICEPYVQELLGSDYIHSSQETDTHPTIPYWVGSKDAIKHDEGKTVTDTKCPITLKSFCQLVQPLYDGLEGYEVIAHIRDNHPQGEKYYFQLVSNAVINKCKYAELIVFMPYKSQLDEIKLSVDGNPNAYWIAMAGDNELPFLKDGGYYKNLNIIRFEVPERDIQLLTDCVTRAGDLLIPYPKALAAPDSSLEYTMVQ